MSKRNENKEEEEQIDPHHNYGPDFVQIMRDKIIQLAAEKNNNMEFQHWALSFVDEQLGDVEKDFVMFMEFKKSIDDAFKEEEDEKGKKIPIRFKAWVRGITTHVRDEHNDRIKGRNVPNTLTSNIANTTNTSTSNIANTSNTSNIPNTTNTSNISPTNPNELAIIPNLPDTSNTSGLNVLVGVLQQIFAPQIQQNQMKQLQYANLSKKQFGKLTKHRARTTEEKSNKKESTKNNKKYVDRLLQYVYLYIYILRFCV